MGGVGKGPGIGWLRDGKCVAANFSIFERFKIKQGRQNDECLSMYIINTIPHGKCFVRYLRTPCFCNRNLTRSLRLLVRQHFPLSILYKTKRVTMIRLSVKVNRTGLCTEAHFPRNEIKYHQSQESGLFFYKCYSLSPS